jgi:tetratricopeptide (TPR) repeat protein
LRYLIASFIVIALAAGVHQAGAQQTIRSAKVAATSAKIYIEAEKWDDALTAIRQGLALEPDHPELNMLLGQVLAEKAQLATADSALMKYAQADSAYKKALLLDPGKAEEVDQLRKRTWAPLMRDGLLALKEGKTDEAETFFRNAATFWPEKAEAYIELGAICFEKKDYPCAVENFRTAKMITPDDPAILKNLATSYTLSDQPDSALAVYKAIRAAQPDDFETKDAIATILLNAGKYEAACALFDSILVGQEIEDPNTLYNAGVAYAQTQQPEKAVEYFEKVLTLAPDDNDAMVNLSMIYVQKDEGEKAIPLLEKLTEKDPQSAEYWNLLAIAYTKGKRESEAQAAFSKYKELTGGK